MSEIVTTYLLTDPGQPLPMKREEFYEEQAKVFKRTGKPSRAVAVVQVLLFTPDKEIILQRRSLQKKHNPGLIDKSVGGHISFGDAPDFTVMTETLQELQAPSIVVDSQEDFRKTFRLLRGYLNNTSVIQLVDWQTANLQKIFGKNICAIANKYYFYLGVYGGAMKPSDKEATGIMYYNYAQLVKEIKKTPELFTSDIKFFLNKYHRKVTEFLKLLK